MNRNVMVLKDGTEITTEEGSDVYNAKTIVDDLAALGALWDRLTQDALSEIYIKDADGAVMGNYTNMALCSPAFRMIDRTEDGKIQAAFSLRNRTEVELLKEQIEKLSMAINVHDGAIGDIGAVLSAVAEAQEGMVK